MKKNYSNAGDGPEQIVPFYSERTLEEIHQLVKELPDGLVVYVSKDHAFATIGTRGIRPLDGVFGLIIHVSVNLRLENNADKSQRMVLDQPCHNLRYTSAIADDLKKLLIRALEESAFVPSGLRIDDDYWNFF